MDGDEIRERVIRAGERGNSVTVVADILADLADKTREIEEALASIVETLGNRDMRVSAKFQFFDDWANAASKRIEALERTACIKGVDHD